MATFFFSSALILLRYCFLPFHQRVNWPLEPMATMTMYDPKMRGHNGDVMAASSNQSAGQEGLAGSRQIW
jgi:hypothetical protein